MKQYVKRALTVLCLIAQMNNAFSLYIPLKFLKIIKEDKDREGRVTNFY
jgi:hypothetical protein